MGLGGITLGWIAAHAGAAHSGVSSPAGVRAARGCGNVSVVLARNETISQTSRRRPVRRLALGSTLLCGALASGLLSTRVASAQVVLDPNFSSDTIGAGEYAPGLNTDYLIREAYGQRSGDNLFHRFSQFDIPTAQSATFIEDAPGSGIRRVIAHVGGSGASQIDGVLRSTIPNADLYFYNARGVVFGPNSQLDLLGSFYASSANSIRFSDDVRFGEIESGAAVTITAAAPSAWGFLSNAPAEIAVEGARLRVPDRSDLSLVAGPIRIEGPGTGTAPNLAAPSGALQLVSLGAAGEVAIDARSAPDLDAFSRLGAITLGDGGLIDASGVDDQILIVRGDSLSIDDATILANHTGLGDHPGVAVDLAVRGEIRLGSFATGTNALLRSVNLRGELPGGAPGPDVGNAGAVLVRADSLRIDGPDSQMIVGSECLNAFPCAAGYEPGGAGGALEIDVDRFSIRNGGLVVVQTFGRGDGSSASVRARVVEIGNDDGARHPNPGRRLSPALLSFNQGFFTPGSNPPPGQDARGGDLDLVVGDRVQLENGGRISSLNFQNGTGGDIRIETGDFEMTYGDSGAGPGLAPERSAVLSQIINEFTGNPMAGEGTAGDIEIVSRADMRISPGAISSTATVIDPDGIGPLPALIANGLPGAITLRAPDGAIRIEGTSTVSTIVNNGAAPPITLESEILELRDGGQISSLTRATGRAGDLVIRANDILISGTSQGGARRSGLFSKPNDSADLQPNGASGSISIDGARLRVENGATINVDGARDGAAGNLLIGVAAPLQSVTLDNATIEANTSGAGALGGDIEINAGRIRLDNAASISASNIITGGTGSIRLNGDQLELFRDSEIAATSGAMGVGGDIVIRMRDGVVASDSRITTDSRGSTPTNQGGNIDIEAQVLVLSASALRASAPAGAGGRIRIVAGRFLPTNANPLPDATGGSTALDGEVTILSAETSTQSVIPRPNVLYEDPSRQLATGCESRTDAQGSLYVLPRPVEPPPGESLSGGSSSDALASGEGCGRWL